VADNTGAKRAAAIGVIGRNQPAQSSNMDDYVIMRSMMPHYFEDLKKIENTTVWMKNGYVMPYFAYTGGQVLFATRVGVIPAAQRMDVKKIVKSVVPAEVDDSISHGSRQAFAVFALPGDAALYATPIGAMQSDQEAYFCDMLFYYDDPHTIYDHWPKDVWAAIDAHQVKPGMSELETRMAIGRKMLHTNGDTEGNRTEIFDQAGRHWTVTFVNNKATAIKSE